MTTEKLTKAKTKAYSILTSTVFIVLATGTIFYHTMEKWSWIDSLYFSVITLTTVGYGDLTPSMPTTKIFTIIYIILGIGIIFAFINQIARNGSNKLKRRSR